MTDRELLELAAKAAGISVRYVSNEDGSGAFFTEPNSLWWNPLEDDGDALRLAVDLRIDLFAASDEAEAFVMQGGIRGHAVESLGGNPYAATRRAIVRAAAEIGRQATRLE